MTLEQFYEAVGGSAAATLKRLGSETMARRFLGMFAEDESFAALETALRAGDAESAFRAAHTMKGVAANLGLTRLQEASSALTEALRGGTLDGADGLFPPVAESYRQVRGALEELEGRSDV